jgi:hypothetical protein
MERDTISYQMVNIKINQFALALDIICELRSSFVQVELTKDHIRLSCQDVFQSSQFEFLMDEIICENKAKYGEIIGKIDCDKLKKIIKEMKAKIKNKEIKEKYPFWFLEYDGEENQLKLTLEETFILPFQIIPCDFLHKYDTSVHQPCNYIFEVTLHLLLHGFLIICLGNGYFSFNFTTYKNTPVSNSKLLCLSPTKTTLTTTKIIKTQSKPDQEPVNNIYKIIATSFSETGECKAIFPVTLRKSPLQNSQLNQSIFYQKMKDKKHQAKIKEKEEHVQEEKTNVSFACKFLKHFLTVLQGEQTQCLVYFIEKQNRCIIEPKGSPFRFILLPQSQDRVQHSI